MKKATKKLFCPNCRSYFTCDANSINTVALRNHSNRSQLCKELYQQKRHRTEIMSTDRVEKQPKLSDKCERSKTLIDHHVPTKAQFFSSADEHMETFEGVASDNGCYILIHKLIQFSIDISLLTCLFIQKNEQFIHID